MPRLKRTWTVGQAEDRAGPLGMGAARSGLCIRATHFEPVSSGPPIPETIAAGSANIHLPPADRGVGTASRVVLAGRTLSPPWQGIYL